MGDGPLLLPSKGGDTLVCPCLFLGLACGSHIDDESVLLSMRGSGGGLSRNHSVVLLPLSGGDRLGASLTARGDGVGKPYKTLAAIQDDIPNGLGQVSRKR
jgi:hypothetical protein